jgi:hypothetical protein
MSLADDINYKFWPILKKEGETNHNFDEYHMVEPSHWQYPPEYLANSTDKDDHQLLQSNWKEINEMVNKLPSQFWYDHPGMMVVR